MLTEEEWLDRLMIEGQNLKREQPTFRRVRGSWTHWRGEILGSGIYEGGVFLVEIIIPREYPFKPPRVRWITPTWHPNLCPPFPAGNPETPRNTETKSHWYSSTES
ncbi:MAG: ubiquitin-conjugating enzyme E2 [Candidatus Odinarchaeota archaeon]